MLQLRGLNLVITGFQLSFVTVYYRLPSSSTSKSRVASGGMTPPAPLLPYPSSGGMTNFLLPPSCKHVSPSCLQSHVLLLLLLLALFSTTDASDKSISATCLLSWRTHMLMAIMQFKHLFTDLDRCPVPMEPCASCSLHGQQHFKIKKNTWSCLRCNHVHAIKAELCVLLMHMSAAIMIMIVALHHCCDCKCLQYLSQQRVQPWLHAQ